MYVIYPHDSAHAPFVLRRLGEDKLVVMDEYQDLVCQKCGKVNEKAALVRGIQRDVVVESKRPIIPSADNFYLVNDRGKQVFSALAPSEVDFYRIPASDFYVASARTWLQPQDNQAGFRFVGGRCSDCARAREVVWDKGPLEIGEFKPFLCINLENRLGACGLWLVSEELADQLKKTSPPLTGMVLDPKRVNDKGIRGILGQSGSFCGGTYSKLD
jgi:hypothetical protein